MNDLWQRFVRSFRGAEELAAMAILVALGGVVGSAALLIHWLTSGRYVAAIGLMVALGATAGVCVRDFRRGRWSVLSGILLWFWLLITVAAFAFGIWLSDGQN